MKSELGHIQINVTADHLDFYRSLMDFLGWKTLHDGDGMLGVGDEGNRSLWFTAYANESANDYDGVGTNHIGIHVDAIADVDETASFLADQAVDPLFDTPRHRPEFSGEGTTYYQVMFESPDGILFEVVYIGPTS